MNTALQHSASDAFMDDVEDLDGVDLKLTVMDHTTVWIDLLLVHPPFRGQGLAREQLELLNANADAWGIRLGLRAGSMSDTFHQRDLEAFYARMGFVGLRRSKEGYTMFREPSRV